MHLSDCTTLGGMTARELSEKCEVEEQAVLSQMTFWSSRGVVRTRRNDVCDTFYEIIEVQADRAKRDLEEILPGASNDVTEQVIFSSLTSPFYLPFLSLFSPFYHLFSFLSLLPSLLFSLPFIICSLFFPFYLLLCYFQPCVSLSSQPSSAAVANETSVSVWALVTLDNVKNNSF